MLSYHVDLVFSEYPIHRSKKDSEGVEMGVAGSVSLLQNVTLSTQPVSSLDWSPDKRGLCICSSFDQTVRVLIVTKLQTIWPALGTRHLPEGYSQNWSYLLHPLASLKTLDLSDEWQPQARSQPSSSFSGRLVAWRACCCRWRCHTTGPALFLFPIFLLKNVEPGAVVLVPATYGFRP